MLVCLVGIADLHIDTSTASFLDRSDPAWQDYQDSVAQFGGDEFVVVALKVGDSFDPASLDRVEKVSGRLLGIDGVRRVDSVATVNLLRRAENGSIHFEPLVGLRDRDEQTWANVLEAIQADPVVPGGLISADERMFAINVFLDENVDADRAKTVREIRQVVEAEHAFVSGVPTFRTAVNSRTRSEVLLFVPVTVLIIASLLLLVLRSVSGALAPICIGGVGSLSALGAMGWLGVPLSLSTLILPSVLLALGCAYSIHVVLALRDATPVGQERALLSVAEPVALSGLTTVIGFLAMATVNIEAIRELATYGAVGVLAIAAAALTLLPAALRGVASKPGVVELWLRGPGAGALVSLLPRRNAVVAFWVAAFAVAALGFHSLVVSTDIILWFQRDSPIRADYEVIRAGLSGITPVNVVVSSGAGEPVTAPAVIAAIDGLTADLQSLPFVGKAVSIAGPLARFGELVSGKSSRDLPRDSGAIQQFLLVLEGAPYIRDLLTADHSAANIMLRVDSNSSDQIVSLKQWVDAWWQRFGVAGYTAKTTGIMFEFARSEEQIAYGQIRGLSLALGAIALVLVLLLGSGRMALVALIPNVVPLGIAFGTMGFGGVPLDAATVCLGTLSLGIAVDDTIHLLVGYRASRAQGAATREALAAAFERVLPAVALTSIVCGLGFLVLVTSGFTLIQNLGWVTAAMMLLCLAADVTLLPALLMMGRGGRRVLAAGRTS